MFNVLKRLFKKEERANKFKIGDYVHGYEPEVSGMPPISSTGYITHIRKWDSGTLSYYIDSKYQYWAEELQHTEKPEGE